MISSATTAMKQYVGIANAVPDSRTPRRFISAMTTTTTTAMSVTWAPRTGKAEARLATPAETDTATVSV